MSSNNDSIYTGLLNEGALFSVFSSSLLLLTVSLVFFHMTKLKTVEMKRIFAKVFCITFILLSIIYLIEGLIKYHKRNTSLNQDSWDLYLITGIVFIALEISIAIVMIEIMPMPKKIAIMTTRSNKKGQT
jgi:hypothetical protein